MAGSVNLAAPSPFHVVVEVGGVPVCLLNHDLAFSRMLEERYAGFTKPACPAEALEFEVRLAPPGRIIQQDGVRVSRHSGRWRFERNDFEAEWDPDLRRGWARHSANPYSIDSILRILHTFLLAPQGGFLVHSASAVRDGRAFLFCGLSGAGKTTISRLAPPDVTLLTDEVSYVRPQGQGYWAFGTPFAGELGSLGVNVSAPISTLFLLAQGAENRCEPVPAAEAARALLRNILFFAEDTELARLVFQSACEFVCRVPVHRLTFVPHPSVWELIV